jgi:hypothetical protein
MKVIAKLDTTHLKYGDLKAGQELEIDAADFGDQIFKPIPEPRPALRAVCEKKED